jgi:prephenate dehydrogenase
VTGVFFNKITVLGVGLIGASFAQAARKNGICSEIVGFGRSRENLARAQSLGIIDSFKADPADACEGADLIVLSSPVGSFLDLVRRSSSAFRTGTVVTDTGSVKGAIVHEIERLMPSGVHFIGGHPIAGGERSGIDAASPDLFASAKCIVTPTDRSDAVALEKITGLWMSFGSQVLTMDPDSHDRVYAYVSHLPHVIAYTLVNTVGENDRSLLDFVGQGFLDTTRIAASSPELWRDVCLLNRENVLESIRHFQRKLDLLEQYLTASDGDAVGGEFMKAQRLREGIGQD